MSNAIPTRSTGALLHVTCLPSNEGIGTMNKKAITQWLEFLKAAGIRYWQICHTIYVRIVFYTLAHMTTIQQRGGMRMTLHGKQSNTLVHTLA